MNTSPVNLVYFSPTRTTRTVLEGIARGISDQDPVHIDLTPAQAALQDQPQFSKDVVLIGAPVYAGRLPAEAVTRLKQLKADNTPAVLVVLYGNREFEDALLELKDLAIDLGFAPMAGAAFIGEHSFARKDLPIANGRPDEKDLEAALAFGAKIKEALAALNPSLPAAGKELRIPGNRPYRDGAPAMAVAPQTHEADCTLCGTCADACPTAAIAVTNLVHTDAAVCIRCCACIKTCPEQARFWDNERMEQIAVWLNENCSARKAPEFFGVN